jgi:trans-aconitate methyltransferase
MNGGNASLWDGQSSMLYAAYCDKHDTYSVTSAHLVELVADSVASPTRVVDLACGTGVTSLAVRSRFGNGVEIIGVDRAEHMLDIARTNPLLWDVKFVHAKAELISDHVEPYIDAILCNSAFWLMNMPAVLRHAWSLLSPGGVFAFSCPGYLLRERGNHALLSEMPALMLSFAEKASSSSFTPSTGWVGSDYSLSEAALERMADAAGFALSRRKSLVVLETNQATYDAMQIPAILERYFPAISPHKRLEVLESLFKKLEPQDHNMVTWYSYLLIKNSPVNGDV